MSMATADAKSTLRKRFIAQRKALSPADVSAASTKIIQSLQNTPAYQSAQHIAWYFPVQGEIDLSVLWQQALNQGKTCYCPRIQGDNTLIFLPFTSTTSWINNRYGIPEPDTIVASTHPIEQLDLIFLPVLAFDVFLNRLGMGKGYYDKTLAQHHTGQRIGVAYEWQKQTKIPCDPWDIPLNQVFTDVAIYP